MSLCIIGQEKSETNIKLLEEAKMCETISADIKDNSGLTKYQRKRVVNQAFTQSTQQGYVSEENKDKDADNK